MPLLLLSGTIAMGNPLLLASRRSGRFHSFIHSLLFFLVIGNLNLAGAQRCVKIACWCCHSCGSANLTVLDSVMTDGNNKTVSLALSAYNEVSFQLFRLSASGALLFQQSITGVWQAGPETLASLTVAPKPNSPLAACSWSPSGADGDTQARLYYLDSSNKVIELVGVCKGTSCKWANNGLVGVSVSGSSGLAAVLSGDARGPNMGIKVFYVGTDSVLSEVTYNKGTRWQNSTVIGPKVAASSSLAASVDPTGANFQVYYHAADSKALSHISYDNSTQTWSQRGSYPPLLPSISN